MRRLRQTISTTLMAVVTVFGILATGCDRRPPAPPPAPTPEVAVVTVQPQRVALTTELPGRTAAFRVAQIRPQVNGLILKRLFIEGAKVEAGQELYRIDPAPFQAALDQAVANRLAAVKAADQARAALGASIADVQRIEVTLDLARINRRRYEAAFAGKVGSAAQRDQAVTETKAAEASLQAARAVVESGRGALAAAEAAIEQAEAAVRQARINLGYTRVSAPISGRIGRSAVTEGAVVTAYQPMALATIQQIDPIYVDVPQSTTELLRLQKSGLDRDGDDQRRVGLVLEDGTPYGEEGTLQFSDITVDPTTGSVILRVVFPNPDQLLLPNMFVQAVIQEGVQEAAILVPQQGVSRDRKGNPMALVVDAESKAMPRPLKVDRAVGDQWLVSAGLAPGDRVIVEGLTMLRPGTPVRAVDFQEANSPKQTTARPAGEAK